MQFTDRQFMTVLIVVLISCTGYGISFPLLAIELESRGLASALIGLNAAMPAIGWLLGSAFLPYLQRIASLKTLIICFLSASLVGLAGLWRTDSFELSLVFRFLFGGGIGMFFRMLELWINANSTSNSRGRNLGFYATVFIFGIMLGSIIMPEFQEAEDLAYLSIAGSMLLAFLCVYAIRLEMPKRDFASERAVPNFSRVYMLAPVPIIGIFVYGFFEDVPAYLLSVYALKLGHTQDIAAYTLSAVALGILLFSTPAGWLSDKVGRIPILTFAAFIGLLGAILIPLLSHNATFLLAFLVVWGGSVGSIYNVSQAMIGDRFDGHDLIEANAAFGSLYALAAVIGPLANGFAMQLWEPHGLMVSTGMLFASLLLFTLNFALRGPER